MAQNLEKEESNEYCFQRKAGIAAYAEQCLDSAFIIYNKLVCLPEAHHESGTGLMAEQ